MKEIWKKILIKIIAIAADLLIKQLQGDDAVKGLELSSTVKEQWLFLQDVGKLIAYTETIPGYALSGGELFRTPEQQAIYLAKGLSKTSNSKHLKRMAIDLNLFVNGVYQESAEKYKPLAEFWVSLNPKNKAGYHWGWDANHFERT